LIRFFFIHKGKIQGSSQFYLPMLPDELFRELVQDGAALFKQDESILVE
jgi:hypothetical protein